mmetsp:Transcript_125865/g.402902  ORF Transcript_125865/g.402902 Transcript_125865/m.402902 type:complete len:387 (-) Transcript_125865:521-1681(-)
MRAPRRTPRRPGPRGERRPPRTSCATHRMRSALRSTRPRIQSIPRPSSSPTEPPPRTIPPEPPTHCGPSPSQRMPPSPRPRRPAAEPATRRPRFRRPRAGRPSACPAPRPNGAALSSVPSWPLVAPTRGGCLCLTHPLQRQPRKLGFAPRRATRRPMQRAAVSTRQRCGRRHQHADELPRKPSATPRPLPRPQPRRPGRPRLGSRPRQLRPSRRPRRPRGWRLSVDSPPPPTMQRLQSAPRTPRNARLGQARLAKRQPKPRVPSRPRRAQPERLRPRLGRPRPPRPPARPTPRIAAAARRPPLPAAPPLAPLLPRPCCVASRRPRSRPFRGQLPPMSGTSATWPQPPVACPGPNTRCCSKPRYLLHGDAHAWWPPFDSSATPPSPL